MKNQGTIYVVMPAYNVEKFIAMAFDSLRAQTYPHWKCLCMNDGSTDKTWQIMQEYARKDKRILIFRQENKGLTKTMNILLNKVKGPYLAFVDSDDCIHPQMFEILLHTLLTTKSDVSECQFIRFFDSPEKQVLSRIDIEKAQPELLTDMSIFLNHKTSEGSWINKWNKLYLWHKVKDIRFSEELSYEDDYFYSSLIHDTIQTKALIDLPLYFYRRNPNGACGRVNWTKYQTAGINRIRLSYDYFIKGNRVPPERRDAFMSDLAQDAYRMIVRKPLKKTKDLTFFRNAALAVRNYVSAGIIDTKYLSLKQRIHLWLVAHDCYRLSRWMAKLT